MFSSKHSSMIDLKEKRPEVETKAHASEMPRYPTLYLDKDIGLSDKDLNKKITAKVEIRTRRISKTVTNGETKHSCELEIMGIDIS